MFDKINRSTVSRTAAHQVEFLIVIKISPAHQEPFQVWINEKGRMRAPKHKDIAFILTLMTALHQIKNQA